MVATTVHPMNSVRFMGAGFISYFMMAKLKCFWFFRWGLPIWGSYEVSKNRAKVNLEQHSSNERKFANDLNVKEAKTSAHSADLFRRVRRGFTVAFGAACSN